MLYPVEKLCFLVISLCLTVVSVVLWIRRWRPFLAALIMLGLFEVGQLPTIHFTVTNDGKRPASVDSKVIVNIGHNVRAGAGSLQVSYEEAGTRVSLGEANNLKTGLQVVQLENFKGVSIQPGKQMRFHMSSTANIITSEYRKSIVEGNECQPFTYSAFHGSSDRFGVGRELSNNRIVFRPFLTRTAAPNLQLETIPRVPEGTVSVKFRGYITNHSGEAYTHTFVVKNVSVCVIESSKSSVTCEFRGNILAHGPREVPVTLTACDSCSRCTQVDDLLIVENAPPVIHYLEAVSGHCKVGDKCVITFTYSDPSVVDDEMLSVGIDWGDTVTSFPQESSNYEYTHVYTQPGTHDINVIVSDGEFSTRKNISVNVIYNTAPQAQINVSSSENNGTAVLFIDASGSEDPQGDTILSRYTVDGVNVCELQPVTRNRCRYAGRSLLGGPLVVGVEACDFHNACTTATTSFSLIPVPEGVKWCKCGSSNGKVYITNPISTDLLGPPSPVVDVEWAIHIPGVTSKVNKLLREEQRRTKVDYSIALEKGKTVPQGYLTVAFKRFWLVASAFESLRRVGSCIQFDGYGTVDYKGRFGFRLTACASGHLHLIIWNLEDLSIWYDNLPGVEDFSLAGAPLYSGSINVSF